MVAHLQILPQEALRKPAVEWRVMSTLKDRIEKILADPRLQPDPVVALARVAGVSSSAVSQWKAGLIRDLKAKSAANIQRELGYSATWINEGELPETVAGEGVPAGPYSGVPTPLGGSVSPRLVRKTAAYLPVLPWDRLTQMRLPNDRSALQDLPLQPVANPASPYAKLVEVNDLAMAPRLRAGDLLQFDPDVKPVPHAIILVRDGSGQHYVRIYRQRTATVWEAAPADAGYATLSSDVDDLTLVAVATHRTERLLG